MERNLKIIARLTGLGYLGIFITGFFANFFVLEGLVVKENATTTYQNFINHPDQFYMGLFAFGIMIIFDIILAFPLYQLLKDDNKSCAKISSILRVLNGLYFLFSLSYLVSLGCDLYQDSAGLEVSLEGYLHSFNKHWSIGLIIFGLHLLILGNLIRKSFKFPSWIGVLLTLASIGYLLDSSAQIGLFGESHLKGFFANMVVIAGTVGESALTLYLIIKGVRKSNA